MKIKAHLGLFFVFIFTISCEISEAPSSKTYLTNSVLVNSYSKDEFTNFLANSFGGQSGFSFAALAQYGIKQYKISYSTTTPEGKSITASGALIVPQNITTPLALASYQHGTIFDDAEAPSYFANSSEALVGSLLASTGLIVCMPDYIGYADSKTEAHPYEHAKGLAEPSIDFIRAISEFISKENLNWNTKLLLCGYSEGGYATMAIHKSIEENYKKEFNLVATTCGAGAYDKTATLKYALEKHSEPNASHISSYIWVLQTYNQLEKLNRTMDYYLKPEIAAEVSKNGPFLSYQLTVPEMVNTTFKAGILNGTDKETLKAFASNDIYNWKPIAPLKLYHGTSDTYVPYLNTENAYNAMKKRNGNVTMVSIPNGDHGSSILTFFTGTLEVFTTYR